MCGWCREISTDTSLQIYKSSLHPRGQTGTVMFFSEQIAHQTVKLLGDTHPEQSPLFPCNFAYIRDFQVHEVHGQIQTHIGGSRTNHPHTQVAPGAFSFPETNRFLMGPCAARGYGLPAVSPLHRCDCAWAPPRCGARHEALNEGLSSAVGGFTRRGSWTRQGNFHWEANRPGFLRPYR